mgnify:CR=1 FL=1
MLKRIVLKEAIEAALNSAQGPGGTSAILAEKLSLAIDIYVRDIEIESLVDTSVQLTTTVSGVGKGIAKSTLVKWHK